MLPFGNLRSAWQTLLDLSLATKALQSESLSRFLSHTRQVKERPCEFWLPVPQYCGIKKIIPIAVKNCALFERQLFIAIYKKMACASLRSLGRQNDF